MATYTTRNDLKKPDYTDAADIEDLNDNFDFIDGSIAPCEWAKAVDPTADDDVTLGYIVGSMWVNTTGHKIFICEDNTDTAALWRQLYPNTTPGALLANGTVPLTADWDVGAYHITADHFVSDVADGGAAPFASTSKVVCTNLNADMLDGLQGSSYAILAGQAGGQSIYGGTATTEDLKLYPTSKDATGFVCLPNGGLCLGTKATTATNGAVRIHEGAAGAPNPITFLDGDGSTAVAGIFKNSSDQMCIAVGDNTTADFTVGAGGCLGIGGTAVNSMYQIGYTGTPTDQASEASVISLTTSPTYTGAESVGENYNGIVINHKPIINSGHTNSGRCAALYIRSLRNYNAADTNDAGTLTELIGLNFSFGHLNTHADETPVSTSAYGLRFVPYYNTGTITNLYGMYIAAPGTGGTATNRFPIYSLWDDQAYFQGQIYTAGNCSALTFTDRTPGYDGDGLADIKKIKNKEGKIDHDTLPEFARKKVEGGRVPDEEGKLPPKYMEDGRDLGAMISILTKAVQQLSEKNDELEARIAKLEKKA